MATGSHEPRDLAVDRLPGAGPSLEAAGVGAGTTRGPWRAHRTTTTS